MCEKSPDERNQRITASFKAPRCREDQMEKIVRLNHRLKRRGSRQSAVVRPSRGEAEEAVRTLIRWACDDTDGVGLVCTPARVSSAYVDGFAVCYYNLCETVVLNTDDVAD